MRHLSVIRMHKNLMHVYIKIGLKHLLVTIVVLFAYVSLCWSFEPQEKAPAKGNLVIPLSDVNVQMMHFDIEMKRISRIDRTTHVRSEYVIENLAETAVTFTIAFPIESDCLGDCTDFPKNFKVYMDGKQIKTIINKLPRKDFLMKIYERRGIMSERTKKDAELGIREGKIYQIPLITWDVSLKPHERKTIKTLFDLYWLLDVGSESLEYEIGTTVLWKGSVQKGHVKMTLPQDLIDNIRRDDDKLIIRPKGYKRKGNTIEWWFIPVDIRKETHIDISIEYNVPSGIMGD